MTNDTTLTTIRLRLHRPGLDVLLSAPGVATDMAVEVPHLRESAGEDRGMSQYTGHMVELNPAYVKMGLARCDAEARQKQMF